MHFNLESFPGQILARKKGDNCFKVWQDHTDWRIQVFRQVGTLSKIHQNLDLYNFSCIKISHCRMFFVFPFSSSGSRWISAAVSRMEHMGTIDAVWMQQQHIHPYSFSCIKISHCRMFFCFVCCCCFFSIRIKVHTSCSKQNGAHGDNRCCLNATTTYSTCLARYKNVARGVLISLSIFSDPL